mmetsp:Transcript_21866/g.72439  ORF Transcript_21866/g.72439 Transcript_21866/m.72439 type:complete len:261 (-) Transcript_21866:573-1355(-)
MRSRAAWSRAALMPARASTLLLRRFRPTAAFARQVQPSSPTPIWAREVRRWPTCWSFAAHSKTPWQFSQMISRVFMVRLAVQHIEVGVQKFLPTSAPEGSLSKKKPVSWFMWSALCGAKKTSSGPSSGATTLRGGRAIPAAPIWSRICSAISFLDSMTRPGVRGGLSGRVRAMMTCGAVRGWAPWRAQAAAGVSSFLSGGSRWTLKTAPEPSLQTGPGTREPSGSAALPSAAVDLMPKTNPFRSTWSDFPLSELALSCAT